MSKHTMPMELTEAPRGSVTLPRSTRGFRRDREKRERKRARVAGALIVGLDLGREKQAVSFRNGTETVARSSFRARPREFRSLLDQAEAVYRKEGLDRFVVSLEPAGHYWKIAAEVFERHGVDYVVVHPLSVKRAREETRYSPDKSDPKDAELIAQLASEGKFTEARLPRSREIGSLDALSREYLLLRKQVAAERVRLVNFWDQFLTEYDQVFSDPCSATALAIGAALLPLSELITLSDAEWCARVRSFAQGQRIQPSRAVRLIPLLRAADADPFRRSVDGLPVRICGAAERRRLGTAQKLSVRARVMEAYGTRVESAYLDSIPGSEPLYNALVLGLVGNFGDYDDPRCIVKLAGCDVIEWSSGDYTGCTRISHRGRSLLRGAAYQQARYLVRRNPQFAQRYHDLLAHGRQFTDRKAYTAIANSYLRTAHALICKKELYKTERRTREARG